MKHSFCSFVICLAVVAHGAMAQEKESERISIETLVQQTIERNPEIKFYQAELAAAKGEKQTASTYANPDLNVDLGYKRASGAGVSSDGLAWSVSLMQPLEFPGRMALRKAIANRQVELAEIGLEQFRASLASRIRTLAYTLLVAQEKTAAAADVASRGQELAEILVQRDPAGVTPLLESRIIEASVLVAKRRAAQAKKEEKKLLYELNQLRGAPLDSPLRIADTKLRFPSLPPIEELIALAGTNNLDLRTRQVELAQQGLRVDLSQKGRWKGISAGPYYSQEKAIETEREMGIGISMPLPLWNRNKGEIETQKAREQQAQTALLVTQREIERQILEQAAAYEALMEQMSFWRSDVVAQLRESVELGDRHFRLGALPVQTYVELQSQYLDALEAILDTRQEALESFQELNRLTGFKLQQPFAASEDQQ